TEAPSNGTPKSAAWNPSSAPSHSSQPPARRSSVSPFIALITVPGATKPSDFSVVAPAVVMRSLPAWRASGEIRSDPGSAEQTTRSDRFSFAVILVPATRACVTRAALYHRVTTREDEHGTNGFAHRQGRPLIYGISRRSRGQAQGRAGRH